jgi:cell division protein FtsW
LVARALVVPRPLTLGGNLNCGNRIGISGVAPSALLLAVGLLAQLELGLGAPESSWLRHAGKTGALLAIGAGACGCWRLRPPRRALPLPQARRGTGPAAADRGGAAALLLQVASATRPACSTCSRWNSPSWR